MKLMSMVSPTPHRRKAFLIDDAFAQSVQMSARRLMKTFLPMR
jgi:hypothetical protein